MQTQMAQVIQIILNLPFQDSEQIGKAAKTENKMQTAKKAKNGAKILKRFKKSEKMTAEISRSIIPSERVCLNDDKLILQGVDKRKVFAEAKINTSASGSAFLIFLRAENYKLMSKPQRL
jgi:hypothetical protein